MRTITHSELRNKSGQILREVEAGDSFLVSNRGKTVAAITPASAGTGPRLIHPATRSGNDPLPNPIDHPTPIAEVIDELRGGA